MDSLQSHIKITLISLFMVINKYINIFQFKKCTTKTIIYITVVNLSQFR